MNLKTILVVDDDPINIKIINEYVLALDPPIYEVLNSSNATLALKIAMSVVPDLIITDWEMPEMNGIEFIEKLKSDATTQEIPVIMASGIMTTSEDLDLALSTGAVDYIRKPIDKVELIARTRTVLELSDHIKEIKKQKELILKQQKEIQERELTQIREELQSKEREISSSLNFLIKNENEKENLLEIIETIKPHLDEKGQSQLRSALLDFGQQNSQFSLVEMENKFDQINAQFYNNLEKSNSDITKNEKVLSTFLVMNLSPSEIALITKKSLNSVNVAFSRLRDKLNQPTNKSLKSFLEELKS